MLLNISMYAFSVLFPPRPGKSPRALGLERREPLMGLCWVTPQRLRLSPMRSEACWTMYSWSMSSWRETRESLKRLRSRAARVEMPFSHSGIGDGEREGTRRRLEDFAGGGGGLDLGAGFALVQGLGGAF